MSADVPRNEGEELQFDRAESAAPAAQTSAGQRAVVCKACAKQIVSEYYQLNGNVTCASCRAAIANSVATPTSAQPFVRALGLGILAAIAGAAIYYAVAVIANIELALIAIAIGYMVGWAVRRAAGNRGGRRFQIMAIVLTYWAVGLAYTAIGLRGEVGNISPAVLFFEVWALPVLVIAHDLSGIINLIIIAVGMRQAWQMTGAPVLKIEGPFRVGSGSSAAAI